MLVTLQPALAQSISKHKNTAQRRLINLKLYLITNAADGKPIREFLPRVVAGGGSVDWSAGQAGHRVSNCHLNTLANISIGRLLCLFKVSTG